MAVTPRAHALARLKAAAMTGAPELAPALAADVTLDASRADEPRRRVAGRGAVLAELARWWPREGTLIDWQEQAWEHGAAVTLERLDEHAHLSRLRLYLRWREGSVVAIWAYAARPRPAAHASPVGMPDEVLARVAPGGRREPLVADRSISGAGLDRVVARDGTTLIAKRVLPEGDWIGRTTGDPGREALLPYARLPAVVTAVEADPRRGWWVVMRDVSGALLPADGLLSHDDARLMLGSAAVLHREFADGPRVEVACALEDRLALHAPSTAEAERGGSDLVPKQLEVGWEGFVASAPSDVAEAVLGVLGDPAWLAAELRAAAPSTLLHGDLRDDNVAVLDGEAALIDWGLASWGPASVELAWFLLHDAWRIAAPREELLDDFRVAEGDLHSERALELGLLSGLVTHGWLLGHSATVHPDPCERAWANAEIAWWSDRARRALA
jgi:hypothetical protein